MFGVTDDDLTALAAGLDADAWDGFWTAYGIVLREVVAIRQPVAVIAEPVEPEPVPVVAEPEPVRVVVADIRTAKQADFSPRPCPVCGKPCRGEVGLTAHRRKAHVVPPTKVLPPAEPAPLPDQPTSRPVAFQDRAAAAHAKTWAERTA